MDWIRDLRFEKREARKEGLAEGQEQARIETARIMLTKNFSIKDIAEISGLSISKIEELK